MKVVTKYTKSESLESLYIYYTSCAIATYEWFAITKSAPKSERKRTLDIATEMIIEGELKGIDMNEPKERLESFQKALAERK